MWHKVSHDATKGQDRRGAQQGMPASAVAFGLSLPTKPGTALHGMAGGDVVGVPSSGG
jgi:hypothetical protein